MRKATILFGVACLGVLMALASLSFVPAEIQPQKSLQPMEVSDKKAVEPAAPAPEPEPEEPKPEAFYVVIAGNDTREGTSVTTGHGANGDARTDTLMIMRVDPATYQLTLVTIPRDTKAVVGGMTQKINEAYNLRRMEGTIDHVQALTGVTVKYYLNMSFLQFAEFIDGIGGVDVNVPLPVSLSNIFANWETIYLEPGEQHLNGQEALVFARSRKSYGGDRQDAVRQIQDRQIVQRVIESTLQLPPEEIDARIDVMMAHVDSYFPIEDLKALAHDFAEHKDQVKFLSGTGPWQGDIDPESGLWLTYGEDDVWLELMRVVDEGGDPNTVVPTPEAW